MIVLSGGNESNLPRSTEDVSVCVDSLFVECTLISVHSVGKPRLPSKENTRLVRPLRHFIKCRLVPWNLVGLGGQRSITEPESPRFDSAGWSLSSRDLSSSTSSVLGLQVPAMFEPP